MSAPHLATIGLRKSRPSHFQGCDSPHTFLHHLPNTYREQSVLRNRREISLFERKQWARSAVKRKMPKGRTSAFEHSWGWLAQKPKPIMITVAYLTNLYRVER